MTTPPPIAGHRITLQQYYDAQASAAADGPTGQPLTPPVPPPPGYTFAAPRPPAVPEPPLTWAELEAKLEHAYTVIEEHRQQATTALDRLAAAFGLHPAAIDQHPEAPAPPEDRTARLIVAGLARGRTLQQIADDLSHTAGLITRDQAQRRLHRIADGLGVPREHAAIVHQAYRAGWLTGLPAEPRSATAFEALAPRLRQALEGMAAGRSNQQMAHRWGLSVHTVKTHGVRLFRHLDARNRAHAVALGHQCGHLTADQPPA